MAINLSNVNISIRQFQEASSGTVNAGEVRLKNDHSLKLVNHHTFWTSWNDVSISHAEVLAIKDAFVRALSDSGVDRAGIDAVRRELGLAPDGLKDTSLAQRSIKPLSREKIREILDRYAEAINNQVGHGTIRTDAQIHGRYTLRQIDNLRQTRNERNAALMYSRTTFFDRGISDVQSLLSGDVQFRTAAERDRLIDAAVLMKERILARFQNGRPSTEPGATMRFTRAADGFNVTFALGGSDAEFLKRLDDMLLALRSSSQSAAVSAQPVQPGMHPYAPTLSPVEYRKAMRQGAEGNDALLTHEMKTMRDEVLAELRTRFGADIVPENAKFGNFVFESAFNHAFGDVENGGQRRTYDEMKNLLVKGGAREASRQFFVNALKPMLQAAGVQPGKVFSVASTLLRRHPEMRDRINTATSPDNARAIIQEFKSTIDAGLRRQASIDRYRDASADWYREALANELHIPVSSLAGRAINVTRLSTTTTSLADKIGSGVNTADSDEQIEQAFRAHVANAVAERVSILRQIEALHIFGEAHDVMVQTVLMANTVGNFDLAALKAATDAIPVGDLVVALDTGTNDEIFTKMGTIARAATNAAKNAIDAQDGMLEEVGTAGKLALAMTLAKRPEVFSLMRNFFLRPDIQDFNPHNLFHDTDVTDVKANANAFFDMFKIDEPVADSNAALADLLDKPGIPPIAAQAVYRELDGLGFDDLGMAEKTKLLSSYDGRKIAQQVRKSTQPVTHDQLQALVRMQFVQEAAHHALILHTGEVARRNGIDPAGITGFCVEVAFRRDGALRGKLVAAIADAANRGQSVSEAVKALVAQQDAVLLVALRSFAEIRSVNATIDETAIRGISNRAEIDRNAVEKHLSTQGVHIEGGSLSFLIDDIRDRLSKPETDITAWDATAVRRLAEERVQSFIDKKVGFIAAIRDLDVPDATKGELIVRTLENRTYTDIDFPVAVKAIMARKEIKAAFEFAKSVLVPGKVERSTPEELFGVFQEVSARINEAIQEVLPEAKRLKMDNDDYAVLQDILNAAFVGYCGDTLLAAAASFAAVDRFDEIDEAGNAVHQRYNTDYMNAMSEIDEEGKVKVNEEAAIAANKNAAAAAQGRRLLAAVSSALNDEWLPADDADAIRRTQATPEQKARAAAAVKRAPALLDRYAAGMDADQRAELKAFLITLDLREEALEASEGAIRAKATEIKFAAGLDA